jgi:hypothetical protein
MTHKIGLEVKAMHFWWSTFLEYGVSISIATSFGPRFTPAGADDNTHAKLYDVINEFV